MRKLVYAFAIIAAAASTAAVAGEIKQDQKSATPTVSATQMSDAEMDKVTAGVEGRGILTAIGTGNPPIYQVNRADPRGTGKCTVLLFC